MPELQVTVELDAHVAADVLALLYAIEQWAANGDENWRRMLGRGAEAVQPLRDALPARVAIESAAALSIAAQDASER